MRSRFVGIEFSLLLLCAALTACGDLDTMISTSSSYSVGALVDDQDLADQAVVGSSSVIRPVFDSDAVNDPDAAAFRVSLLDSDGQEAAEAVEYQVKGASPRALVDAEASIVSVNTLSGELPTFSLPADLPVGRYSFLFEVLGEDGVLFQTKRAFYYIADKTIAFASLVSYPPGSGPTSSAPLFPTGVPLLLEASVEADGGLDPFLVWSYGGKKIASGRFTEGKNRILWTTPDTSGFYRIDATLYPVVPQDDEIDDLPGIARTLTVATSSAAAYPGLAGNNADFESIYRFLGDLQDSGAGGYDPLSSTDGGDPSWLPFSSGYGVAVGPLRSYGATRPAVPVSGGLPVPSRIVLAAAPLGPGSMFRATFKNVDATGEDLILSLEALSSGARLLVVSGEAIETAATVDDSFYDGEVRHFSIELRPSDADSSTLAVSFFVDDALVGEMETPSLDLSSSDGSFSIGGAEEDEASSDAIVAVVDDLAVSLLAAVSGSAETDDSVAADGIE